MKTFRKIIYCLLTLLILGSLCACNKYEPLIMKETTLTTYKGYVCGLSPFVDFEANGISNTTEFQVTSSDEAIVKFENNKLVFGNKIGEATLEIIANNKKGILTVNVVPYMEYLKSECGTDYVCTYEYYAARWLLNNLNSFKNPNSVEVMKVAYPDSNYNPFDCDFFLLKIRAQNGFGGYGVEWYKVTSYNIQEADVYENVGVYYGDYQIYQFGGSGVQRAIKEYRESN